MIGGFALIAYPAQYGNSGIMPERRRFAKAMKAAVGATFPFLTDMDNGYALSLNLAIWIGADMRSATLIGC